MVDAVEHSKPGTEERLVGEPVQVSSIHVRIEAVDVNVRLCLVVLFFV
jgi:hypothetical protein